MYYLKKTPDFSLITSLSHRYLYPWLFWEELVLRWGTQLSFPPFFWKKPQTGKPHGATHFVQTQAGKTSLVVCTGGIKSKKRRCEHDPKKQQSKGASPMELLHWQPGGHASVLLCPQEERPHRWERTEPHQRYPRSTSHGHKLQKLKICYFFYL